MLIAVLLEITLTSALSPAMETTSMLWLSSCSISGLTVELDDTGMLDGGVGVGVGAGRSVNVSIRFTILEDAWTTESMIE